MRKIIALEMITAAFTLTDNWGTPTGVIIAYYKRAGEVKLGDTGG